MTGLLLHAGKNFDYHFVAGVEFARSLNGVDCLTPLVTNGVEPAEHQPERPIMRAATQFSFYQCNGHAGSKVFTAVLKFLPPGKQNTPPHPYPLPPGGEREF